jgi:hypothetical protein
MKTTHTARSTGPSDGLWTHLDGHTIYTIEVALWEHYVPRNVARLGKYRVTAGYVEVPPLDHLRTSTVCGPCLTRAEHDAIRDTRAALHAHMWIIDPDTGDVRNGYDKSLVQACGNARTSSQGRKARRRWLLCLAECLWRHGACKVTYEGSGNNRRTLVSEAHESFARVHAL